jgi:hypothetical protein
MIMRTDRVATLPKEEATGHPEMDDQRLVSA